MNIIFDLSLAWPWSTNPGRTAKCSRGDFRMSCGNFHCMCTTYMSYLAGHRRGLQECCRPRPLRYDCRCRKTNADLAAGVEGRVKVVGIVIHIPTHLKISIKLTLISARKVCQISKYVRVGKLERCLPRRCPLTRKWPALIPGPRWAPLPRKYPKCIKENHGSNSWGRGYFRGERLFSLLLRQTKKKCKV